MALIYNATFDKNTRKLSFEDKAGNEIYSFIVPERTPMVDDITKPLTFKATQDGSMVTLKKEGSPVGDFQTSRDGGNTWEDYTIGAYIPLSTGDKVSFRAKSDRTSVQGEWNYFYFMMEGKIEAWHNVMSLYRTSDFATYESVLDYSFYHLFAECASLTKAPVLPAITLADSCYRDMFKGCTSLTEAPVLPATTLASGCYWGMFYNCTSLTKAPELPVTTLANNCYREMFRSCTSLTKAPVLTATTLADSCYYSMFDGCKSLTEAPALPVTTLATSCYKYMFINCTSLTEAPELPATTLAPYCYQNMFYGCTSLTKAPELPATTLANNCYREMFQSCSSLNEVRCKIPSSYSSSQISSYTSSWLLDVSSTGTFYTNADANWPTGVSGIPDGWRRVNEGAPTVDNIRKPLTFRATQDGSTVKLTKSGSPKGDFQTSWDGGKNWGDYPIGTAIPLNTGEEVSFRAKADRTTSQDLGQYFYFEMTGKIEAWHNVMSMIKVYDFTVQEVSIHYAFFKLFKDCTSLTKAPILPATTLTSQCYRDMFNGCTSMKEAPELPATTLTIYCYAGMFNGCTSLVNAPILPVTTLAKYCYFWMFSNCTSLVKAPELRATTLAECCYTSMFYGCSSLNEVHCQMPSTISEEDIPTYTGDGSSASLAQWLEGVSSTGTFYTNEDANWPSGASGIPTGWNRVPAVDDITKPLTFKATQDGSTVALTKNGSPTGDFQTSTDGGNTWTDYTTGTAVTLNTGDEVSFRAKADRTSAQSSSNYFGFQMTGKIEAWHNVMSLYRTSDFATYNTSSKSAFSMLFYGCTSLTKAPALPATTLANYCYRGMFNDCTSLTKAPALPATTLADYCYDAMFYGCTSLTKAPALPATTLTNYCYQNMFGGCTSLTETPVLPVTTLTNNCYNGMFKGCTSLTKAPELPATTLASNCYQNMFGGCTSLTEAPVLPVTTLTPQCYRGMFEGCTSLTKAPELPATTLASNCYTEMFKGCSSLNEVRCQMPSSYSSSDISSYAGNWLSGVSSTGTFYTNADANWPSGASGIPTGWTRIPKPAPATSDVTKPLTFRATQNGSTVTLKKQGFPEGAAFQTSTDGGNTWEDYTIDTVITLNTGDEVSFRAKADREFEQSDSKYFQFNMTGKIEAWHNVMSLYRTSDFATYDTVMKFAFYQLFKDCISLTKAPRLPATTLALSCYSYMFSGCTSLTKAPYLPATSLAETCYKGMFRGCTSLTEDPILQATRLGTRCYDSMFSGCSSLNEVHCDIPSSYSTEYVSVHASGWLYNVSPTGTFHTNADANWASGSASGIPEGWTRVNG